MKRGILFINGELGIAILESTITMPDILVEVVVLNAPTKRDKSYRARIERFLDNTSAKPMIYDLEKSIWQNTEFLALSSSIDFGISALFGHIIPKSYLQEVPFKILNLHPSFLPWGKGADPIPWSIMEKTPQGATIHEIDAELDAGPIVIQRRIQADISMNSGEVYQEATSILLQLYIETLRPWLFKEVLATEQIGDGSFHHSKELQKLRLKLETEGHLYEEVIAIFQALTFSDGRLPRVKASDGTLWEVNLTLNRVHKEENW